MTILHEKLGALLLVLGARDRITESCLRLILLRKYKISFFKYIFYRYLLLLFEVAACAT